MYPSDCIYNTYRISTNPPGTVPYYCPHCGVAGYNAWLNSLGFGSRRRSYGKPRRWTQMNIPYEPWLKDTYYELAHNPGYENYGPSKVQTTLAYFQNLPYMLGEGLDETRKKRKKRVRKSRKSRKSVIRRGKDPDPEWMNKLFSYGY